MRNFASSQCNMWYYAQYANILLYSRPWRGKYNVWSFTDLMGRYLETIENPEKCALLLKVDGQGLEVSMKNWFLIFIDRYFCCSWFFFLKIRSWMMQKNFLYLGQSKVQFSAPKSFFTTPFITNLCGKTIFRHSLRKQLFQFNFVVKLNKKKKMFQNLRSCC